MNRTLTRALTIVLLSCAAAAAQPVALAQLRDAAGPSAVSAAQAWGVSAAPRAAAVRAAAFLPGSAAYDDGRDDAARLCGRLPFDSDKNSCLMQVSRARYIERRAADVCSRMSFNDSIPGCLSAIADKAYLVAETDVCGREAFDDGKVECLRTSGRPEWGPYPGNDNREEAAATCSRASFDSDRAECVQVVGRAYYFDRGAIGACSALSFSQSYPPCFRAIADKEYLPAALEICAKESFDDSKISCLQSAGAPWNGLPRWPYPRWPNPRRPLPPR